MSAMIPNLAIIDMVPFREGGKEGRNKVAQEIYDAAHNVGFLYLKNFGMSEYLLETAFSVAKSLFLILVLFYEMQLQNGSYKVIYL